MYVRLDIVKFADMIYSRKMAAYFRAQVNLKGERFKAWPKGELKIRGPARRM